jgi:hypothetical protein
MLKLMLMLMLKLSYYNARYEAPKFVCGDEQPGLPVQG